MREETKPVEPRPRHTAGQWASQSANSTGDADHRLDAAHRRHAVEICWL